MQKEVFCNVVKRFQLEPFGDLLGGRLTYTHFGRFASILQHCRATCLQPFCKVAKYFLVHQLHHFWNLSATLQGRNVSFMQGFCNQKFPTGKPFCSHLREFLEPFAESGTNLTILGDINVDLNKTNPISKDYVNTLNQIGFSLLINQPTRIFHNEGSDNVSCSTIDHIITNSSAAFTKVGILVADVSDHLPIFGLMSLKKCTNPFKNTYRRIYHDSKKDDFVTRLKENVDNNNFDVGPNLILGRVLLSMKDAIEQTFSWNKVSNKQAKKILNPWMTTEILDKQKFRDKLKKEWIKSGKIANSPVHLKYKKIRNKVVNMCNKAKRAKIQNKCKEANGDSSKMWKVINRTLKLKDKPNTTPDSTL